MNILVLLRVGRDPASFTVNRKAQKIFVHRDEWRTNPSDLNALEAALVLGEQGHTVTALAVGGEEAAVALREARAMGAARAVWVKDEALREIDAGPLVVIVQRVIGHIGGAEVILLGQEVPFADLAQVAGRLAAALGRPLVPYVSELRIIEDSNSIRATLISTLASASLPAVCAARLDGNRPRYAPAANIMRIARDANALELVTTADLGLPAADLQPQVTRRGERYPSERVLGELIEGSAAETVERFAAEFRNLM